MVFLESERVRRDVTVAVHFVRPERSEGFEGEQTLRRAQGEQPCLR